MPSLSLQPRFLAALVAVSVLALAAPASALGARACDSANATPGKASNRTIVRATLCVLNAQRVRVGLRPLRLNRRLSDASRRHALDMARRNYFSHTTLGGGSFLDRIRHTGYLSGARRWVIGENLAWGTQRNSAPLGVAHLWMNSPGHRANILNRSFDEIGIGVAYDAPVLGLRGPAATYATDFGARS